MTLAILCSGQGNQHPGMFDLTGNAPAAAAVFAAATRVLGGRDPRALVRDAGVDIHANALGQVLCCTQALAAFAALKDALGGRLIIAGYSVGELASWGCTGLIDPALVLDLAAARAAAMDAAGGPHDGLGYIRGLDRASVDALCAAHEVAVAIVNPGDMVVIGGGRDKVAAACDAATAKGAAHVGTLKVAVASHTPRLAAASESFRANLQQVEARRLDPRIRLLSGIDASAVRRTADGLDKLARQISQTIDWAGCLDAGAEAGMSAALELGPGNALATMTANAHPGVNARALDDFRSLAGVEQWLADLEG